MSRSALTAAMITASQADNFVFGLAAELDFSSGMVRVNTSPYTLTIDGDSYLGVGDLGKVSPIDEEASLAAKGVSMQLSGVDPTLLSKALDEHYQGRAAKLWVCLFDDDHQLISDPYPIGIWRMDSMDVEHGETGTITLTAESPMADWDRPRVRYYTDQDHQSRYPGDKFFEMMPVNIDKEILWGRT